MDVQLVTLLGWGDSRDVWELLSALLVKPREPRHNLKGMRRRVI